MLAAGCGSAATGPARSTAPPARAAGSASVARSAATGPGGAGRSALARRYLAIAVAGNHHLEHDFDGLRADHGNLAAARAYLRDAAATERLFDTRLLQFRLPATMGAIARLLVTANEARARLSQEAAAATSFGQVRGFERRLTAANVPVEDAVRVLRSMLGLPPPQTS